MAGNVLPTLGRVKLLDLLPTEGLPTDQYKLSVSTLSQSLAQYSAAIIQLPLSDAALLRSCLDSSRLYFNHKPPFPHITHVEDSHDWCKTSGYRANSQVWQESYDFRPGVSLNELNDGNEIPPAGLVDVFAVLGKACRGVLDAISFYLNLRSLAFDEVLDNVPLRDREVSSSVVSVCCHGRPGFEAAQHHSLTEDGQLGMFDTDHDQNVDRSLLSIVKSDRAGMHVRDFNGHWVLVDSDLGPQEAIVYPGLALYQATAGYINPAMHRVDLSNLEGAMYGRCSLAFKLMPKSVSSLSCAEMRAAGHGVDAQFQMPVPVDDFMQRSADQVLNRSGFATYSFPAAQEGSIIKPLTRRKRNNSRSKPLPPSKRLRLEAQRVLKERVQDIADKKGLKLRFCALKECESHIQLLDSPCATIRMEIGWPPGVPFVHPHDLPNKAKIGFLETYEPGWSETNDIE